MFFNAADACICSHNKISDLVSIELFYFLTLLLIFFVILYLRLKDIELQLEHFYYIHFLHFNMVRCNEEGWLQVSCTAWLRVTEEYIKWHFRLSFSIMIVVGYSLCSNL